MHRSPLAPADLTTRHGLAVTTLERTLVGHAYHARRREMRRDRHRDADLQGLGYRVLRLVWEDLYDDAAAETIGRLRKLGV